MRPSIQQDDNQWAQTWKSIVRTGYPAAPRIVIMLVGVQIGRW
ncbi:MAG: hypothetical protein ACRDQA_26730 [Nocardioidaceae bacterium]